MARYRVNQHGEVFEDGADSRTSATSHRRSGSSLEDRLYSTRLGDWWMRQAYRQWAWFKTLQPFGKTYTAVLFCPIAPALAIGSVVVVLTIEVVFLLVLLVYAISEAVNRSGAWKAKRMRARSGNKQGRSERQDSRPGQKGHALAAAVR